MSVVADATGRRERARRRPPGPRPVGTRRAQPPS